MRPGHGPSTSAAAVAVAEAKKRGSKSLVRREVVRVVTPGTITEETLLHTRRHNYLAAIADAGEVLGLKMRPENAPAPPPRIGGQQSLAAVAE